MFLSNLQLCIKDYYIVSRREVKDLTSKKENFLYGIQEKICRYLSLIQPGHLELTILLADLCFDELELQFFKSFFKKDFLLLENTYGIKPMGIQQGLFLSSTLPNFLW